MSMQRRMSYEPSREIFCEHTVSDRGTMSGYLSFGVTLGDIEEGELIAAANDLDRLMQAWLSEQRTALNLKNGVGR